MKAKYPYCDFKGRSSEMEAHARNHLLLVKANIQNAMLDYRNKVAFVHVVVREGGNAKGVDVAVPVPLEKKIVGKVTLEGVTFNLLPEK
nr:hypothetical protein [Candidatus Njordarchaeum guaymaensis]